MSQAKKKRRISLHRKLSIYNFLVAIVPVFLAVCITLTFIFSLIHIIYSDEIRGKVEINNSRDVIMVYFCHFNMRIIENGFTKSGTENGTPHFASSAYKRLESYGFSVCVDIDDDILYMSEGSEREYFEDLNTESEEYDGGMVFLDDDSMQIRDVIETNDGKTLRITLKSTGRPNELRTASALKLWQLSDTGFLVAIILGSLVVALIDILLVRSMSRSILVPLENLGDAANRIKLGDLDKPVEINNYAQELSDLGTSFEEMRIQLKKSVESKEEYEKVRRYTYSGLNHDIRTAVTTIKGYTQGLKDGIANTPEKRERYINAISLSTESLEKLVDALSEITKLETSTIAFNFKERDMYSLLTEWCVEMSPALEERLIRISNEYNCSKRVFCNIDTFQFERIVDNLLSNCVKYKKPEADHIDVKITSDISDDGMFRLVYSDNGIGVSAYDAEKIFDPFYRADTARSNVQSGNGFGLSIVKQIIIRHGGSITANGEEGKGLILTIKLPILKTEEL